MPKYSRHKSKKNTVTNNKFGRTPVRHNSFLCPGTGGLLNKSDGKSKYNNEYSGSYNTSYNRKSSDFSLINFDRNIEDNSIGNNMVKQFQQLKKKKSSGTILVESESSALKSTEIKETDKKEGDEIEVISDEEILAREEREELLSKLINLVTIYNIT